MLFARTAKEHARTGARANFLAWNDKYKGLVDMSEHRHSWAI